MIHYWEVQRLYGVLQVNILYLGLLFSMAQFFFHSLAVKELDHGDLVG